MDDSYSPIDFSGIVGYPHDISEDVIDNLPDYHDYGDGSAHIRAFTQCIDNWCDPPIYEDVIMRLFVMTLAGELAYDWFHDSNDKKFKTMRDLLFSFLYGFGRNRNSVYNELVDDFMETWERKNLLSTRTTNSDTEVDSPPDPIKEINEVVQNIQFPHEERCEAMNE
jgi:hypothetical protein